MYYIVEPFHTADNDLFKFVTNHCDVFWHPSYYKPFVDNISESSAALVYQNKGKWGVYSFILQRMAHGIVTNTPYGYGGLVTSGNWTTEENTQFNCFLDDYCLSRNIVEEKIRRVHPFVSNENIFLSRFCLNKERKSILMDTSLEFSNQVSKQAKRNLKIAKNNKLRYMSIIGPDIKNDDLKVFYEMYIPTMVQAGASFYYLWDFDLFKSLLKWFQEYMCIINIIYNGIIIGSFLCLHNKQYFTYYLCGYKKKYSWLRLNNFAYYAMYCTGKKYGCQYIHLGGGTTNGNDGLYRFKSQHGNIEEQCFSASRKV